MWIYRKPKFRGSSGFSLIELIVVIAIIVVLVGILFPVVNSAQKSALKSKSHAQFSQYMTAIVGFRQEYGYFPFASSSGDTVFFINHGTNRQLFENVLSGESGTINRREIPFYRFTEEDLEDADTADAPIVDAFGNTQIAVLMDTDNDGWIRVGTYEIRGTIEMISVEDDTRGYPLIKTWDE